MTSLEQQPLMSGGTREKAAGAALQGADVAVKVPCTP